MRYPRKWQLALVCLVAISLFPLIPARPGRAQTAVTYTVTDIGTLGGEQSKAHDIDNCGRVVGESFPTGSSSSHPFIWINGQFTDMGTFGGDQGAAFALNDTGVAAGSALTASEDTHALIWSSAGGKTDLGVIPGGTFSSAYGINDSNQVVGLSEVPPLSALSSRGFIWEQATGMRSLPTLGGRSGAAYGINNAGSIVGTADTANSAAHAFILSGGTMTDLGTLSGGGTSVAYKINDGAMVVGYSTLASNSASVPFHGFIWSSATGMLDMGTLGGSSRSIAYAINSAGQAVGWSEITPSVNHAFIYTSASGMLDLNDLSPGSGWTFTEARGINDRGQIVGFGTNPSGKTHAFLLTPDNVGPAPCSQPGSLQFSDAAYSVSESGTKATITVTRTGGVAGAVSVNYATSDGTAATADSDYQPASGTLSFADGETSKTFDVNVTNDSVFEPDETVNLTLSNPQGGATLGAQSTVALTITNDDAAPTLAISDVTQSEGNVGTNTFSFIVTRTGATELPASASFATADGTATTADGDYVSSNGSISFAANETTKQINVTVNGDSKFEPDEDFFVNLSNPSGATIAGGQGKGIITNEDAAPVPGTLQFSAATYNVAEGDGTATITVTRTGGGDGAVSVSFATANATATAGQDYASNSGTLNFANGDTAPKTFTVTINDDTLDESDETISLGLSNATGGAGLGAQSTATLTINDNDPPPTLQFSSAAYSVGEGGTTATITVTRTGGSNGGLSVDFATATGGTATNGSDYTANTGTLNFGVGDTQKTFTVAVNDDTTDEADETVNLSLSNPQGGAGLGTQSTAVLTIDDNDPSPSFSIDDVTLAEGHTGTTSFTFTVTKTGATALASSVNFATADGTAHDHNPASEDNDYQANGGTLSFAASDTSKTVTVNVNGDTTPEGSETFFVNLSGATNASISDPQGLGTISNDDATLSINDVTLTEGNGGTTNAVFNVSLTLASVNTVTVNFATADGTATVAGGDYNSTSGQLTFNPGELSKDVTVQVKGDTLDEPDETFFVNLSGATNASLSDSQGLGTITDDDGPPSLAISDVTVTEGDSGTTSAVFNVTLTPTSGQTATVNFATANGTATSGSDYVSSNGQLTFAPGDASKVVTVQVSGDTVNEPDETFFVNLSGAGNASISRVQGQGTITNDDTPRLQFSQAVFNADESQHFKTVNVTRTGDPSIPVTVDYATSDGTASERSDYTVALGTLSFGTGETAKSFDVLLTDDAVQEPDETVNLSLSNPTGGAALGGQSTATVLLAASDDPPAASNPIDDAQFFVRQHYHDFLGREPDSSGLAFWTGEITQCGSDVQCREAKRINVSAAFFLSIEFQQTGYLVERMYKAAYGDATGVSRLTGSPVQIPVPVIRRSEFLADSTIIRNGLVVGAAGWEQLLENNKNAFALAFVQRQRFRDAYPTSMTPAQFVARLNQNTGGALQQPETDALAAEFGGTPDTSDSSKRASVFRKVAEGAEFDRRETNRAFVLMQFFGYLQRDPDATPDTDHTGWKFWLDKLNQFNGNFIKAEMVKAFLNSDEYRKRFGQ
jgi:probable HAF family extracellular repeat protein